MNKFLCKIKHRWVDESESFLYLRRCRRCGRLQRRIYGKWRDEGDKWVTGEDSEFYDKYLEGEK